MLERKGTDEGLKLTSVFYTSQIFSGTSFGEGMVCSLHVLWCQPLSAHVCVFFCGALGLLYPLPPAETNPFRQRHPPMGHGRSKGRVLPDSPCQCQDILSPQPGWAQDHKLILNPYPLTWKRLFFGERVLLEWLSREGSSLRPCNQV